MKNTFRVAYIVSRFPTVTETFILYEILELKRLGAEVEIFPLLRQNEYVKHDEVKTLERNIHYADIFSFSTLFAQLYWLMRRPGKYIELWWRVLAGNIRSLKFFSRALVTLPLAARFALQMRKLGVDHIHAHWATHPALAAYIIQELIGTSYSFTAHAHDIFVERSMLAEKINGADFVATISEYNRKVLSDLYGEAAGAKIHVIRCGVDLDVFQRCERRKSEKFSIICVASLKDYKGHTYLLRACSQLKDRQIEFRCQLVGDGEMRGQIERDIVELGLTDYVNLLGFQPRHRVRELLTEADVMALPSIVTPSGKKEGIPVALMEALAVELPVVATSISGIPELIEDGKTGLLVSERDVDALTTALLRIYNEPEFAREIGRAGRVKVMAEYDLRRNAENLYALLNKDWTNTSLVEMHASQPAV